MYDIKYLRLQYNEYAKIQIFSKHWKNLFEYISNHCAASLEVLECYNISSFNWNVNPLIKLQKFYCLYPRTKPMIRMEILDSMPNLVLNCCPTTLKKHYPNLEKVELSVNNCWNVLTLICFLNMNRQIKKNGIATT